MRFKSKKEFFLSVLGFSAGYGTLWRFPYGNLNMIFNYLVAFKNGGGVFLIPYLFFFFVLVIPIFYHELALG